MSAQPGKLVKDVKTEGPATIVVLCGDVDLHHSPDLHATLVDVAGKRPKRLILDLTEVNYIDSSGVGTFVEVLRRVNAYKGQMLLFGLSERVRSVFEITRLDKFFKLCANKDEAMKA